MDCVWFPGVYSSLWTHLSYTSTGELCWQRIVHTGLKTKCPDGERPTTSEVWEQSRRCETEEEKIPAVLKGRWMPSEQRWDFYCEMLDALSTFTPILHLSTISRYCTWAFPFNANLYFHSTTCVFMNFFCTTFMTVTLQIKILHRKHTVWWALKYHVINYSTKQHVNLNLNIIVMIARVNLFFLFRFWK